MYYFDCSIFIYGLLISLSAEQQDADEVEVRVVDVWVPPDLAPGVVEPHLVAPGELQHRDLAQAPLSPSAITQRSLGPPVTVNLNKQSLVPEMGLH